MTPFRMALFTCVASLGVAACSPHVVSTEAGSTGSHAGAAGAGAGGDTTGNSGAGGDAGAGGTGGTGSDTSGPGCGPTKWGDVPPDSSGSSLEGDGTWKPVWAKSLGEKVINSRSYIATDSNGDFIWAGALRDLSLCGEHVAEGVAKHAFVAKLRADGSPMWLTELVGGDHGVSDLAVEGDRIAIGGYFDGSLDFGGATLAEAGGYHDAFVAVLDSSGVPLWARSAGPGVGTVVGVAIDSQGGVSITGSFQDTIDWGTGSLTSANSADFFVVRLDPSGATTWARAIGGDGIQSAVGLERSMTDDVVAVGQSSFPGLDLGGTVLQGTFLLKLDGATGQDVWVQPAADCANRIARAPGGGYFGVGETASVPCFSKYDEDGTLVFEHVFEASIMEGSSASEPVVFGDRVALGYALDGTLDLGGGDLGSGAGYDVMIGVFDLDGGHVSSLSFGHSDFAHAWSLAMSGHHMLLTGSYWHSLDVGFATIDADAINPTFFMLGLTDE